MASSIDVQNFLNSLDKQYLPRAREAVLIAIDKYAIHVLSVAQSLAPIDTGFLRDSGFKTRAAWQGQNATVTIGFNAHYALAVHERLDVHHPHGQAKYLETAINQEAPKLTPFVLKELKKEFGS